MRPIMHARKSGQVLIEFVIGLSFFLILISAVVDITRISTIQHVLDTACREGVRAAIDISNLRSNESVVLSRVDRVLDDSDMNLPVDVDIVFYISGARSEGTNKAKNGYVVCVEAETTYNAIFLSLFTGPVTIKGDAYIKYVVGGKGAQWRWRWRNGW